MPEFWTWWIENGPTTLHRLVERELRWRRRASSAGRRRPPRRRPPRGRPTARPGAERALGDGDRARARSSTSRRGRRRQRLAAGRLGHRALLLAAGRRCRASPTGCASSRSRRSPCRRPSQRAVRAVLDPRERRVDLRRAPAARPPRAPSRARGRSVARRGVGRGGCRAAGQHLADLVLERPGFSCRGSRSRSSADALARAVAPELGGVDAHAVSPFTPAVGEPPLGLVRASMPASSTILSREACPETSVTLARGDAERLGEQPRRRRRSPCPARAPRDAHLPGVAVPADDARRAGAPGETRSRSRVVGAHASRPQDSRAGGSSCSGGRHLALASASPRRVSALVASTPRRAPSSAARSSDSDPAQPRATSALALGDARRA